DESLALKALHTGRWSERRGERISAMYLYERIVRDHPQTAAAKQALQRHSNISSTKPPASAGQKSQDIPPDQDSPGEPGS
ncbi:MAG: hypothetical protein QGH33_20805, partial [Pirellulaceae bacterium]|nr:hypothetical protein [Pirellulaceae bacterium]